MSKGAKPPKGPFQVGGPGGYIPLIKPRQEDGRLRPTPPSDSPDDAISIDATVADTVIPSIESKLTELGYEKKDSHYENTQTPFAVRVDKDNDTYKVRVVWGYEIGIPDSQAMLNSVATTAKMQIDIANKDIMKQGSHVASVAHLIGYDANQGVLAIGISLRYNSLTLAADIASSVAEVLSKMPDIQTSIRSILA